MIDDSKSEFLLQFESALDANEDMLLEGYENNPEVSLTIALNLVQMRQGLKAIKDVVFMMDTEDEQHVRDLARTGVFSLEDLAYQYQVDVGRIREIIGLGKDEELEFCKKEEWKHSLETVITKEEMDKARQEILAEAKNGF